MGKPRGVTHSTVWPDLEMSLALSVSQSCDTQIQTVVKMKAHSGLRSVRTQYSKPFTIQSVNTCLFVVFVSVCVCIKFKSVSLDNWVIKFSCSAGWRI